MSYSEIRIEDFPRIQPAGYRLAVLRIPFSRKFAITWWLDASGKLARKGRP
jgi:hypothetical protein